MPGFAEQVVALPHRVSLLSLDLWTGAIVVELWVQVLADIHAAIIALATQIQ